MSLTTTKKISLDFYNCSIETVNAKQFDSKSRYINITCTDHGKKVHIDPSFDAYVNLEGQDNLEIATIESDGTISIKLSQQMLEIAGRHKVEVIIFAPSTTSTLDLVDMTTIGDMGTIISTMTFYLNVIDSTIKDDAFDSDPDFNGLRSVLLRAATTETRMKELENELSDNEEERQRIFGDSDDTVENGTMYGVMNSTNNLYTEIKELVGEKTDDSSKDTLYGIKQASKETTQECKDVTEEVELLVGDKSDDSSKDTLYGVKKAMEEALQNCEEATDAANNIANSKADINHTHDEYMSKENPIGTGTLSLNRVANSTIGTYSAAVGMDNTASGDYGAFAEGSQNTASGWSAHVEGRSNIASGDYSHASGYDTEASGDNSSSEGWGTKASSDNQHVQGKFNLEDTAGKYAHIVGNGSSNAARSNAHTVDWYGNAWFKGDVYVGGTDQTTGNVLAKEKDLDAVSTTLDDYISDSTKEHDNINAQLSNFIDFTKRFHGGSMVINIPEGDMYSFKYGLNPTLTRTMINNMLGTNYTPEQLTYNVYIQMMNGDTGGNEAKIIATAYNAETDNINVYFNQKTSGDFRFVYFIYHFGGSMIGGGTT